MRSLVLLIACFMCMISPAFAGDTFPGGPLTGNNGSFSDSNTGTTGETGEPLSLGGGALNTQWYSWTAPVSGFVSFGTCNPTGSNITNFDTTIGIYTGATVNALTQIGFNDDTPGCNSTVNANYGSTVAFNAVAGTVYRIQVDGYGNTVGQFNLFYGYSGFTTAVTIPGAAEGGATGAFTVVLNAVPTGNATITIGTSPQCTYSPTPLTFTIANWNIPQTVTVTAINDTVVEGNHFCAPANLTPSGGGVPTSAATPPSITITDNDTATLSIANTTNGAEAGPTNGVMTVTQSAISTSNTVVTLTISGTATSGSDYTAISTSVTIPAGSTTATITIPVINDAIVETSETVIITLSAVTTGISTTIGTPNAATNTIADNDAATVSITNTTNGSETGPTNGVMTLTQTAVSATNTVIAYSVTGTATSGSDYTALSGTVTIPAGSTTATIAIPVINDILVEGNETVIITLTSITSGLATLGTPLAATNTIADNDAAVITIASTTNASETGPINGVFTVTQTAISPTAIVIAYTVTGTATSGLDFSALSGSVTIPAGATTATITVPVINDVIVEGNETVVITLTSITSGVATLGATLTATNTITDNDSATVSIATTTNGAEAGPVAGGMTVTQTNPSATNTVIAYTVSGTATSGLDYTALSGTITIPAGSTSAIISIPVIDDAIIDVGETVIITLTSITSGLATLGSPLVATNTIVDNDSASFTIAKIQSAGPNPITLAGQTLTYTVTITNTGTVALTAPIFNDVFQLGVVPRSFSTGPILNGDAAPTGIVNIGETWTYTATYAVTQADINGTGNFTNQASFDTAETPAFSSATVTTPITRVSTLSIDKNWSFASPANDVNGNGLADTGDVVTYTYTVVNTGNTTMNNVSVSDVHLGLGSLGTITPGSVGSLAPAATAVFTATYSVVQGDIDTQ